MIEYLFTNPLLFFSLFIVFVLSLSVHEFAHAFVADKLGDPTARYMGRLTLNPLAHLDPIGTLLILVIRIGWGKPVPVNTINFKNPRKDSALVALAGPVSNIILALLFAVILNVVTLPVALEFMVRLAIIFNLTLAVFNLIPIFPLDGFNVLYGVLPFNLAWQWQETRRYGVFILIILMVTGTINLLINYPLSFLLQLLGF